MQMIQSLFSRRANLLINRLPNLGAPSFHHRYSTAHRLPSVQNVQRLPDTRHCGHHNKESHAGWRRPFAEGRRKTVVRILPERGREMVFDQSRLPPSPNGPPPGMENHFPMAPTHPVLPPQSIGPSDWSSYRGPNKQCRAQSDFRMHQARCRKVPKDAPKVDRRSQQAEP